MWFATRLLGFALACRLSVSVWAHTLQLQQDSVLSPRSRIKSVSNVRQDHKTVFQWDPPFDYWKKDESMTKSKRTSFTQILLEQVRVILLEKQRDEGNNFRTVIRKLGDFDALNGLLSGVSFKVPDVAFEIDMPWPFPNADADAKNIVCSNLSIEDMTINHAFLGTTEVLVTISISGLRLECDFDWSFDYGLTGSGDGQIYIRSGESYVTSEIVFTSENFDEHPPSGSYVKSCIADIQVSDMDFQGGVAGAIADTFEASLRGYVEDEIEKTVCSELDGLGTEFILDVLEEVADILNTWIDHELGDPLTAESVMDIPDGVTLLNFNENSGGISISETFAFFLDQANNYLGTNTNTNELGVNVAMRSYLLDENGMFSIEVGDLGFGDDGLIYDGSDMISETKIWVRDVRVYGLDSFVEFNPLEVIGSHTIKSTFEIKNLTFEADLRLEMKASENSDIIIVDPDSPTVTEEITVDISMDNLSSEIAFLVAIDQKALGDIEIGSVLYIDQVLPCILSTFLTPIEITYFSVQLSTITAPTLDGFISPGIDKVVTSISEAAFDMYDQSIKASMPGLFDSVVRTSINTFIDDYFSNKSNVECTDPSDSAKEGFVDFRDLFLNSTNSILAGGNGSEPYGDVVALAYSSLVDFLTSSDSTTGELRVNDEIIVPLTKDQSGVAGALQISDDLLDIAVDFEGITSIDELRLAISGLRIENLDTLVAPLLLLKPVDAHVLDNSLSFRSSSRPLRAAADMNIGFDSDYFFMDDSIEISISMNDADALLTILAMMQSKSLMEFPLNDIFNLNCWLATIPSPTLDAFGYRIEEDPSLALKQLIVSFSSIAFEIKCIYCDSPGMQEIPVVMNQLDDAFTNALAGIFEYFILLLNGDYTQVALDRYLNSTASSCPHHPDYGVAPLDSSYQPLSIPLLTEDTWEDVALVTVAMIEVFLVVVAINLEGYQPGEPDPLSAENQLIISSETKLLNMSTNSAVSFLFEQISDYMSQVTERNELQINALVRDYFLDSNGRLEIDTSLNFAFGDASLSLNSIVINGLDSFNSIEILDIIGNQTIYNKAVLENVSLEADIIVDIPFDSFSTSNRFTETITMSAELKNVTVSLAMLLAIDMDKVGNLMLGSMLRSSNLISCAFSTLHTNLNVTEFTFDYDLLSDLKIEGVDSIPLIESIESITNSIMIDYGDDINRAIPFIIEIAGLAFISGIIQEFTSNSCPPPVNFLNDRYIDFRDLLLSPSESKEMGGSGSYPYGDVGAMLKKLIDDILLSPSDNSSSSLPINDLVIEPLTNNGTILMEEDLFSSEFGVRQIGFDQISLRVYDLYVKHIDSIGEPTDILAPTSAHNMSNNITIGANGESVRLGATIFFGLNSDDVLVENKFTVLLSLDSMQILMNIMALLEASSFLKFPLYDIANIHCWLATIASPLEISPSLALSQFDLDWEKISIKMECLDCSSPGIQEMVNLVNNPDSFSDSFSDGFIHLIQSLLEEDFVQNEIDKLIIDSKTKCPHHVDYGTVPKSLNNEYIVETFSPQETETIIVIISICVSIVVIAMTMKGVKLKQERDINKVTEGKNRNLELNYAVYEIDSVLDSNSEALVCSRDIPLIARVIVPIVVIVNIGFFLSGHLSLGATVLIDINLAGQIVRVDNFFEFSMAKSILDTWDAGAEFLAIIIIIFSGVWPYTKQIITLVLWCTSPKHISTKRRGSILIWLDKFAKWSMMDIFLLVISLVAFRATIDNPDWGFLPDLFYSIEVLVVPKWGLYANMIAQLISQISSHFIIYYHRKVLNATIEREQFKGRQVKSLSKSGNISNLDSESTSNYLFKSLETGEIYSFTYATDCLVASTIFAAIILFTIGCIIPSFGLELLGILGLAIDIGNDGAANIQHGLFSIIETIMHQATYLNDIASYIGLGTLCVLFAVTVLIVPILQSILLILMWFIPMKLELLKRSFLVMEIFQAWQYCEVFLLTVLVATLNLGEISTFMINAYCDALDGFFQFATQNNLLDIENAQCFYVDPSLKLGFYILLIACTLLWASTYIVNKASRAVLDDRACGESNNEVNLSLQHERFFGITWLMTKCQSDSADEGISYGEHPDTVIDTGVLTTVPQSVVDREIIIAPSHMDEVSILTPSSDTLPSVLTPQYQR